MQNVLLQHMHKKEFWILTNKCGNNLKVGIKPVKNARHKVIITIKIGQNALINALFISE